MTTIPTLTTHKTALFRALWSEIFALNYNYLPTECIEHSRDKSSHLAILLSELKAM